MDLLMNGLLVAATLFAGGYCWVLARRVQALKSLDTGLGGSIVTLTRQIELARLTLEEAKAASKETGTDLALLTAKAESIGRELRLLIAAAPVALPRAEAPPFGPQAPAVAEFAALREPPPAAPTGAEIPARAPTPEITLEQLLAAVKPPEPVKPATAYLADVPKPRALMPVENPLRRLRPGRSVPAPALSTEAEILDALSALAGPGSR